ncbi:hypothetical protein C8F01DRAFT_1091261 [Mycena amicta]|nr:hypothetical protein C8F01DRAFT_1091261 [Mycena amicta]
MQVLISAHRLAGVWALAGVCSSRQNQISSLRHVDQAAAAALQNGAGNRPYRSSPSWLPTFPIPIDKTTQRNEKRSIHDDAANFLVSGAPLCDIEYSHRRFLSSTTFSRPLPTSIVPDHCPRTFRRRRLVASENRGFVTASLLFSVLRASALWYNQRAVVAMATQEYGPF